MRRECLIGMAVAVLLLVAGAVSAQAVAINPKTVSFTPSADHAATLSDGTALVTRYELRLFLKGATAPVQVYDLGKPTPSDGSITATNAAWFTALALNAEAYGKVAAIGPGGEGLSAASNPFAMLGPPGGVGTPTIR